MNISANIEAIRKLGQELQSDSGDYTLEVKKVHNDVQTLGASWQGADNQSYVNKVDEELPIVEELGKIIENYGTFLIDTANNLERIQNEIKAQAGQI